MGLTIEVNTLDEMCALMCNNEIPRKRNMRFEEMERYYSQNYGICIYMQYDKNDGRKRYYKISYPVFANGEDLPIRNDEELVKTPAEVKKYIDNRLLSDVEYKKQCEHWVNNY